MGALAARFYARRLDGNAHVDDWVLLGGPNHSTVTAYVCLDPSWREMRLDSSLLRALNAGDETPGRPRYATWRSPYDLVVLPQISRALAGAENRVTGCLLHNELSTHASVYEEVRDWLTANEPSARRASR